MGELKERMKGDLELRCYSKETAENYLQYSQKFATHYGIPRPFSVRIKPYFVVRFA